MRTARVNKFLRRLVTARHYGFRFYGTSRTPFPSRIRMAGNWRQLRVPDERGLVSDLVNVLLDDEYGLTSTAAPVQTVMDVGANVGLFAMYARTCFPAATIHAYEPNPRILDYLQQNISDLNIVICPEGVSRFTGTARIHDRPESRQASVVPDDEGDVSVVSIRSAVDAIGGTVDLLKLDCEGAEWQILKDVDTMRHVRSVRMEYHKNGGHTLDELLALARDAGFDASHVQDRDRFGIAWLERSADSLSSART